MSDNLQMAFGKESKPNKRKTMHAMQAMPERKKKSSLLSPVQKENHAMQKERKSIAAVPSTKEIP